MGANEDPEGPQRGSRRVVIVDDDPLVRRSTRTLLESDGFDVVDEATDAKSAIALVVLHEPDLVVIDHHMPGALGVDTVATLLATSPTSTLVVYTANDSPSVEREASSAGAAAVVDKAGGPDALLEAIHGVFDARR